jgi:hypothetical protein
MTTTISPENPAAPARFDGDELNELLGIYLCKVDNTEVVIEDSQSGGDDALYQLIKPELDDISALGVKANLDVAVMWITDCIIRA